MKPKIPKLVRKRLDDTGVEAHLNAIAELARSLEIRVKGRMAGYSQATAAELRDVSRQLRTGEMTAVQLRYWQDGVWWCDTVMRVKNSYRLVRQVNPPGA